MNYRICVLHWGHEQKYVDLLTEWFKWYREAGIGRPVTVITDSDTRLPVCALGSLFVRVNVADFGPIDPGFVFDRKGAITCLAIQTLADEKLLVVDADAFIRKDPTPLLEPFKDVPFAMPDDFGAQSTCLRLRPTGYQSDIPKRCAGVMWFGGGEYPTRGILVNQYKWHHQKLCSGKFLESRHLYEQHAWACVAREFNAPLLPRTLNWADHIKRYGPNEDAAIYHRIGHRKWRK